MPVYQTLFEIADMPVPKGPFCHGVEAGGRFLFVSGQGPYDPAVGRFVRAGLAEQTRLTLECVERVLAKSGLRRENVVSCRVYLQQLDENSYSEMNLAYERFFGKHRPARTAVGAQLLGIDVEIDCIAVN